MRPSISNKLPKEGNRHTIDEENEESSHPSPIKNFQHEDKSESSLPRIPQNNPEPSILEFKLEKLLNESAAKERQYIAFINQQKEEMFNVISKYGESMERYKKELADFIKSTKEETRIKHYENLVRMQAKNPPNLYGKEQYTLLKMDIQLHCRIKFLYITPSLEDCVSETYPKNLSLKFSQHYPEKRNFQLDFMFDPRLSDDDYSDCIRHGYPIEIYTKELQFPQYQFVLSHSNEKSAPEKVLAYYKNSQLQVFLVDSQSTLEFVTGKIDLEQFLLFSPTSSEQWVEKIPLFSVDNSEDVKAFLHLEMSNQSMERTQSKKHTHKTSEPINMSVPSHLMQPNDKQSRIINRINTYKNTHSNVLLRPTPNDLSQQDKNLLMHQKRKQLEKIERYKQSTKEEYMNKIFGQAIELYHTEYCEVGECKYISFRYSNQTGRHQRVQFSAFYKKKADEADVVVNVDRVQPSTVRHLMEEGIIPQSEIDGNSTIEYSVEDGYALVVNGETVLVTLKVVVHPPTLAVQQEQKYEIKFGVKNQYGENLLDDSAFVRTVQPAIAHTFIMRMYPGEVCPARIQTPRLHEKALGKAKTAHMIGSSLKDKSILLESHWSEDFDILQVRVKCQSHSPSTKVFNVFVYDINYTTVLAVYEFQIHIYQLLNVTNGSQNMFASIGASTSFKFNFRLPLGDSGSGVGSRVLVRFATSDTTHRKCKISTPNSTQELLAAPNSEYPINLTYMSFDHEPSTEKILIHCLDSTTNALVSRWLLKIHKTPSSHKHVYKLICPTDKVYTYNNFELHNTSPQQQVTYRVRSSNYSLLKIGGDGTGNYILFGGQAVRVPLEISYWSSKEEAQGETRRVVVGVDDGSAVVTYLFELSPSD